MDAEILFFMTEVDQKNFFDQAEEHCDQIKEEADGSQFFLGDSFLQFTPSLFENKTLYCGKLEIRSDNSKEVISRDHERAKVTFRKLRNWLKKTYWSRLAYNNRNKKDKLTPSRNYWLGPDAKIWKEKKPEEHSLKLSQTSWMVFEIGY